MLRFIKPWKEIKILVVQTKYIFSLVESFLFLRKGDYIKHQSQYNPGVLLQTSWIYQILQDKIPKVGLPCILTLEATDVEPRGQQSSTFLLRRRLQTLDLP
jgi:hypothetical protein